MISVPYHSLHTDRFRELPVYNKLLLIRIIKPSMRTPELNILKLKFGMELENIILSEVTQTHGMHSLISGY